MAAARQFRPPPKRCHLPRVPRGWYQVGLSREFAEEPEHRHFLGMDMRIARNADAQVQVETHRGPMLTRDFNGIVFAHYDPQGRAPAYQIPDLPEYHNGEWSEWMPFHWRVRTHIQELMENAVDVGHFPSVHAYVGDPQITDFWWKGASFHFTMNAPKRVFGLVHDTTIDLTAHGLACVIVKVKSWAAELRVCDTVTPIDHEHVQLNTAVIFKRQGPLRDRILRRALPLEIEPYITADHPILEQKIFRDRPTLCAADGPIMRLRSWAEQFYD